MLTTNQMLKIARVMIITGADAELAHNMLIAEEWDTFDAITDIQGILCQI